ncbi:Oidioi.mRNA.OKI2018_I69.chr2.g4321.t2.cds [Oikopleura dioica]|uniref:Oidioi.mRNA.OKI2018_I69.chr2.g4321.t2.cds n=1 Tax=Oikopleura dioica TaxID=34765 RepID=A0ABN7SWK9_OIKDI|nr:Oidioi.mRNA.OKI2018_I69.chr2.g4321.t2.cds [Oikopleura dioica]
MIKHRLLFCLFLKILAAREKINEEQPNIIFVLVDDLGWSDVSWNNKKIKATPFLGQLEKHSVTLTSSYSTHRCTPSRASLLTGKYAWRFGLGTDPIDANTAAGLDLKEKLLPEILRENGYSTHHVGKWHLGHCNSSYLPHNRGFDTFYGHTGGVLNYFQHNRAVGNCKYLDYFENDKPLEKKKGVYSTFDFGDHARKLYNEIGDPKFIYLALNAPHGPLMAPDYLIEEMKKLYPDSPRTRLTYLAMVKAIDMEMEKLLGTIWMKNEERDTIIATGRNPLKVFQSDNGGPLYMNGRPKDLDPSRYRQACNYPYLGEKTLLTEGGTLSPTIVYSVKNRFPKRNLPHLFHISDWFPTLLSLAHVPEAEYGKQKNLDGINQVSIFGWKKVAKPLRTKMVYGLTNHFTVENGWDVKFVARVGEMKYYSYKIEAPVLKCPEGFSNDKFLRLLRDDLGNDNIVEMMGRVRNASNTILGSRVKRDHKGYSLFNLTADPFEQNDLAKGEAYLKSVNAHLVEKYGEGIGKKTIKVENRLGWKLPITGPKHNFWNRIYSFITPQRTKKFLAKSGRINGKLVGLDFCESKKDEELMLEILNPIKTSKRKKKTQHILTKLITNQFPSLAVSLDS